MEFVNVLTINTESKEGQHLAKIAEDARDYFPTISQDEIHYLGNLSVEHDLKIATSEKTLGAFLFEKVTARIKKMENYNKLRGLLLGITSDPIVAIYHFFDRKHFKRAQYLVHDYVTKTVGVVSFFQVNMKYASRVVAHGLGHGKGLRHHSQPIDLMYSEMLRTPKLQVEGFCRACLHELTKNQTDG